MDGKGNLAEKESLSPVITSTFNELNPSSRVRNNATGAEGSQTHEQMRPTSKKSEKNHVDNGTGNVLHVQESEESVLKRALKEEMNERRGVIQRKFQLSELSTLAKNINSLPGRSSKALSSSIQSIVKKRAIELYKLGSKHMNANEYTKAINCFVKACTLNPEFVECYIAKGEAFLQLCDFQSAILNYKKACILQSNNEELFSRLAFIFYLCGQCYFDNNKYSEAFHFFSKAVEIAPSVWTYHTRSIACLAAEHKYEECFSVVNQRIDVEKDNPDLLVVRARLHQLFGNSTMAYYDAQDALKIESDHKEALKLIEDFQGKAHTFLQEAKKLDLVGNMSNCLTKVSAAIETDPSVGEFHSYRASLHRRNVNFNAAIDDLLVALDKSNHDESHAVHKEAHRQLLLTYNDFSVECFKKGFFEEAITLLNRAIKIEKNEKTLYVNRGDCFYQTRELHFALSDYLQALELTPNDQPIMFRLSIVYNDLGIFEYQQKRYPEAEDFFSTAIQYQPTFSSYYLSRARARYMMEDLESARVDILSSLHLNPDEKSATSIFTRLFPGKYISEVLSSEFGMLVKEALSSVIDDINAEKIGGKEEHKRRLSFPSSKDPLPSISSPVKNKILVSLKECMEVKELNVNIIEGKKKMNEVVELTIQKKQDLPKEEITLEVKKDKRRTKDGHFWESNSIRDSKPKLGKPHTTEAP